MRNNEAPFEHTCGHPNGLDERGYSVKVILHGRDLHDEHDDFFTSCPTRHTKVGCQLGDPLVPEMWRVWWRECHDLEDLAVGPTSLRLFSSEQHGVSHRQMEELRTTKLTLPECHGSC